MTENKGLLSKRRRKSFALIPVALMMIWCLIPLYVMIIGSMKSSVALSIIPADLNPFARLRLSNFAEVLKASKMGRSFVNSFLISTGTCILTLLIGMMGGYAFAKRRFVGKRVWFTILMITMMLPSQVMMIPRYVVASNLKIVNTLRGVIFTSVNAAYAIFMCRQFISGIPDDLLGAARMDGCSELQSFWHIVLPLSTPVMASLTIFTFINIWNDYVWQNIMLSSGKVRTVPLALAMLGENPELNMLALQFAGSVLSSIPMFVIFVSFQKYFIKGISSGAVKE